MLVISMIELVNERTSVVKREEPAVTLEAQTHIEPGYSNVQKLKVDSQNSCTLNPEDTTSLEVQVLREGPKQDLYTSLII